MNRMVLAAMWLGWAVCGSSTGWATTIWVEGEDHVRSTLRGHDWYESVHRSELSGGDFAAHYRSKAGTATYRFSVPKQGKYTLWVRCNPVKSNLEYRFKTRNWRSISMRGAVDQLNVASDDKLDHRILGWVKVGEFELDRSEREFITFRMSSALMNHGYLDAFCFTTRDFRPRGKLQPGKIPEYVRQMRDGKWTFVPGGDSFGEDAKLDLRWLNESESGESGFVGLSEDGEGFVLGNGEPVRFWPVVSFAYRRAPGQMQENCRFLAKMGVNMVRIHANIAGHEEGQAITEVNREIIEGIWQYVKMAKDEGIYLTISPYWYHHRLPESWCEDLAGYKKGDMASGALFFNPKYKAAYKGWLRELLTKENPHTGLALREDPTVAILQVKNEDSLLFWTFSHMPAAQQRILGEMFAEWLEKKYGSLDKARAAWGGHELKTDDFDAGVVGFEHIWMMTQNVKGKRAVRVNDQLAFQAQVQRDFYDEIDQFLKKELGCKQLTNAMNWKSVDKLKVDDVERWTYGVCDVAAVNRYTGGAHVGKHSGYRIDPGHTYGNLSVLKNPLRSPINLKQPAGQPMLITEAGWVRPNGYSAEGPMVVAAYQSLTGIDGYYWFTVTGTWARDTRRRFNRVKPGETGFALTKWTVATPDQLGMFPANALLYRRGYLQPGKPVVEEHRSLEAMFQREHPIIAETETFDPNRDVKDLRGQSAADTAVSRLAFLVGPVKVHYDSDPAKTRVADLSPYIDGENKTVRSNTGQITLDWDAGLLRIESDRAVGVGGFLKDAGGTFDVGPVRIESENDYATVQVVSMDGRPIPTSEKLLVQVGTRARLTGWESKQLEAKKDGKTHRLREIITTGKPPLEVRQTKVRLTFQKLAATKALLLDPNGYAIARIKTQPTEDGGVTLKLPRAAMYVVLEK